LGEVSDRALAVNYPPLGSLVIDRTEGNEEIFGKLMADGEFRKLAVEHLLNKVYGALKKTEN
jgi:hypothetical protein